MNQKPTSVSILGATGTIGQNCLKVIESNPGKFQVEAITANQSAETLAYVAKQTGAKFAAVADESHYKALKEHTAGLNIEIAAGSEAVIEAAARESDILVAGIVGAAGLRPTLKAVHRGARIALANKECLVCAGEVFMNTAKEFGAALIPVDSEHNAIFQLIQLEQKKDINSITLTASGGPFREYTLEQMASVTAKEAVKHPNWEMGAKISVDSATMINKGLELIEAQHLFRLAPEKLKILVHPESIVHGLASMRDGSVLAQMSMPDMRIPLSYALGYPERLNSGAAPMNLAMIGSLNFKEADLQRFPALNIALQVLERGDSAPTILNAANEIAVQAFLDGQVGFLDIASIIEETLQMMEIQPIPTLDEALQFDRAARMTAQKCIANILMTKTA